MFDELEKFIKQIAEAAQQANQPPQPPQQQRPRKPKQQGQQRPPQQQQQQRPPQPQRLVQSELADAEILEEVELADTADRFSQRVIGDFRGTEEIAAHTRQLGQEVGQADEQMAEHLKQVFGHQVGNLKETAASPLPGARKANFAAQSIVQMLSSRSNVRNALLLAEILRRPTERW
jgi:DNA primase